MVHAIEAYTSAHLKNPVSDMLAIKALELLSAISRPRAGMAAIRKRAAPCCWGHVRRPGLRQSPVAAVHALAYPIGGIFHVPHGLSNALVLAPVLNSTRRPPAGAMPKSPRWWFRA